MTDVKRMSRKERSAATRRAIMEAAHDQFSRHGYHEGTMGRIAEQAGVAVQTVYFVFHTKAELLTATLDRAVYGDPPVRPQDSDWFRVVTTSPSAHTAIRAFVDGVTEISARVSELDTVVRAGLNTDPELEAVWDHHEGLRIDGYRTAAQSFADRGFLRAGVDVAEATDVLLTMLGRATYLPFTRDLGWTDERYRTWLYEALIRLLTNARPPRRRSG